MPAFGQNLTVHKAAATAAVNQEIGALRALIATHIAFQDEAYKRKRDQAEAFLANPAAPVEDFPMLGQISGFRNLTPLAMAQEWVSKNIAWPAFLDVSEILREEGLATVAAAADRAAVDTALTAFRAKVETLKP